MAGGHQITHMFRLVENFGFGDESFVDASRSPYTLLLPNRSGSNHSSINPTMLKAVPKAARAR